MEEPVESIAVPPAVTVTIKPRSNLDSRDVSSSMNEALESAADLSLSRSASQIIDDYQSVASITKAKKVAVHGFAQEKIKNIDLSHDNGHLNIARAAALLSSANHPKSISKHPKKNLSRTSYSRVLMMDAIESQRPSRRAAIEKNIAQKESMESITFHSSAHVDTVYINDGDIGTDPIQQDFDENGFAPDRSYTDVDLAIQDADFEEDVCDGLENFPTGVIGERSLDNIEPTPSTPEESAETSVHLGKVSSVTAPGLEKRDHGRPLGDSIPKRYASARGRPVSSGLIKGAGEEAGYKFDDDVDGMSPRDKVKGWGVPAGRLVDFVNSALTSDGQVKGLNVMGGGFRVTPRSARAVGGTRPNSSRCADQSPPTNSSTTTAAAAVVAVAVGDGNEGHRLAAMSSVSADILAGMFAGGEHLDINGELNANHGVKARASSFTQPSTSPHQTINRPTSAAKSRHEAATTTTTPIAHTSGPTAFTQTTSANISRPPRLRSATALRRHHGVRTDNQSNQSSQSNHSNLQPLQQQQQQQQQPPRRVVTAAQEELERSKRLAEVAALSYRVIVTSPRPKAMSAGAAGRQKSNHRPTATGKVHVGGAHGVGVGVGGGVGSSRGYSANAASAGAFAEESIQLAALSQEWSTTASAVMLALDSERTEEDQRTWKRLILTASPGVAEDLMVGVGRLERIYDDSNENTARSSLERDGELDQGQQAQIQANTHFQQDGEEQSTVQDQTIMQDTHHGPDKASSSSEAANNVSDKSKAGESVVGLEISKAEGRSSVVKFVTTDEIHPVLEMEQSQALACDEEFQLHPFLNEAGDTDTPEKGDTHPDGIRGAVIDNGKDLGTSRALTGGKWTSRPASPPVVDTVKMRQIDLHRGIERVAAPVKIVTMGQEIVSGAGSFLSRGIVALENSPESRKLQHREKEGEVREHIIHKPDPSVHIMLPKAGRLWLPKPVDEGLQLEGKDSNDTEILMKLQSSQVPSFSVTPAHGTESSGLESSGVHRKPYLSETRTSPTEPEQSPSSQPVLDPPTSLDPQMKEDMNKQLNQFKNIRDFKKSGAAQIVSNRVKRLSAEADAIRRHENVDDVPQFSWKEYLHYRQELDRPGESDASDNNAVGYNEGYPGIQVGVSRLNKLRPQSAGSIPRQAAGHTSRVPEAHKSQFNSQVGGVTRGGTESGVVPAERGGERGGVKVENGGVFYRTERGIASPPPGLSPMPSPRTSALAQSLQQKIAVAGQYSSAREAISSVGLLNVAKDRRSEERRGEGEEIHRDDDHHDDDVYEGDDDDANTHAALVQRYYMAVSEEHSPRIAAVSASRASTVTSDEYDEYATKLNSSVITQDVQFDTAVGVGAVSAAAVESSSYLWNGDPPTDSAVEPTAMRLVTIRPSPQLPLPTAPSAAQWPQRRTRISAVSFRPLHPQARPLSPSKQREADLAATTSAAVNPEPTTGAEFISVLTEKYQKQVAASSSPPILVVDNFHHSSFADDSTVIISEHVQRSGDSPVRPSTILELLSFTHSQEQNVPTGGSALQQILNFVDGRGQSNCMLGVVEGEEEEEEEEEARDSSPNWKQQHGEPTAATVMTKAVGMRKAEAAAVTSQSYTSRPDLASWEYKNGLPLMETGGPARNMLHTVTDGHPRVGISGQEEMVRVRENITSNRIGGGIYGMTDKERMQYYINMERVKGVHVHEVQVLHASQKPLSPRPSSPSSPTHRRTLNSHGEAKLNMKAYAYGDSPGDYSNERTGLDAVHAVAAIGNSPNRLSVGKIVGPSQVHIPTLHMAALQHQQQPQYQHQQEAHSDGFGVVDYIEAQPRKSFSPSLRIFNLGAEGGREWIPLNSNHHSAAAHRALHPKGFSPVKTGKNRPRSAPGYGKSKTGRGAKNGY